MFEYPRGNHGIEGIGGKGNLNGFNQLPKLGAGVIMENGIAFGTYKIAAKQIQAILKPSPHQATIGGMITPPIENRVPRLQVGTIPMKSTNLIEDELGFGMFEKVPVIGIEFDLLLIQTLKKMS
jgi:hypothetical protein